MSKKAQLSETKRVLLEKYLRGDLSQSVTATQTVPERVRPELLPLSFAQQQMWFLSQITPGVPVYNETLAVCLPGHLDTDILEQSLNEIIRRHEVWRTNFPLVDGQPVQVIHPTLTLALPVTDLRSLPAAEREAEAVRRATVEAIRPFDLAHGPLLRATLMRLDDADHRLFLTLHHIIFDGITYEVFLLELQTIYNAFSHGKPSPLPPLPTQYASFAIWQREWLQGDVFKEQLTYWKRQLQDAPTNLELPTDHPRPPIQSHRGRRYMFTLPQSLAQALKDLSSRAKATLYMTLVASYQILLHHYTGQDDILLGTTADGRKMSDVQKLLGLFVNTLVLRTNLSTNPSFIDFLHQVRNIVLDAHENRDLPFESLVNELNIERDLSRNPLFQVMLALEPSQPALPSGWTTMIVTDIDTQTSKFDLFIALDERPEGIVGWFEYSTDLFEEATIARMVAQWQILLNNIVQDPTQSIKAIPFLTEMEQEQFHAWNNTAREYPAELCLHQLFEAQVQRTPDAPAIIFEEERLTYSELDRQANQVAHVLQTMGVEPDTLVGIYMERSLEMVIALLAVLKAGGAYVPLEPTYPAERIAYMVQDAALSIVLTQQHLREQLPLNQMQETHILSLDQNRQLFVRQPETAPTSTVESDNLIYLIYTSGSTGRPKGVMNVHRALVNRLFWMHQEYPLAPTDRVLQKTPFGFDISVWEFFWPLLSGATLVIARPLGHQDPAYLVSLIQQQHITALHFVPSMLQMFLAQPGAEHCSGLKYVICSGEALSTELQKRFFATFRSPAITLSNLYGPTEAAIEVSRWTCQRESAVTTVPIGYPLANVQLHILNRELQPVPLGVTGELYIGGVCLARGYLNQSALTREKFIPDPFSPQSTARLYKTGDLARYRSDGAIEFLGRIDNQVKLRGYRIELSEIEVVLYQHPAVQQAIVTLQEDGSANKRLVAHIVLCANQTTPVSDLKRYLLERMPDYMVPSAFVLLNSLPLTPNGKVNRQALPAPASSRNAVEETYVAPATLIHYQLVQIWEELLGVQPVGIRDNFFYSGGHSFLAARLINQIERNFGKQLPLTTLFAGPTIEQLARALQQQETGSQSPLVAVQTRGSRKPFFFLHGDYLGGAFYTFTLARTSGMDQPFYALEPFQFDNALSSLVIEDMAKAYIQTLRTIQPQGPYLLGGFCNGALVAYEIAHQLQAQGEQIGSLVLIDPASSPPLHSAARKAISFAGKLLHTSSEKQLEWFLRLRHIYKYMLGQRRPEDIEQIGILDRSLHTLRPTVDALRQDNIGIFTWIISGYDYDAYPGKVTLLWARDEPLRGIWQRKAATEHNIALDFVPGTHVTCRTDYILDLAEKLKNSLAQGHVTEFVPHAETRHIS